ncbi:MAG TPA: nitroreductase family protein, partial [Thermoleophilia bacterium]|nr:nitroreductase family protein [Thermoleophilia bacterium]
DEPVSEEAVTGLLRAAMAAPSAGNQQPWHFIVIRARATLEKIADTQTTAAMARDAQLAVVVCGDLALEKSPGYWVQDCSAATENMLIAAHAAGLGAVWCGVFPREHRVANIRAILGLPDHIVPLAVVVIGHPAEDLPPADRFRADRVRKERW